MIVTEGEWRKKIDLRPRPGEELESAEWVASVIRLLPTLTHRRVVRWSVFHRVRLRVIGRWLGVTESRVSQIRTEALQFIREAMEGQRR